MTVFCESRRPGRRWLALSLAALVTSAVTAGLTSCGGGTSQIQAFRPTRLIVLGDETSLLISNGSNNGLKYTISGLDAAAARDCLLLPLWVQSLASNYSFVFAECNVAAAVPQAFMRAKLGAKVDDAKLGIGAQLAAQAAADSAVKAGDLVAVMLGANDIIELSERVQAGSLSAADATAEARARGTRLAERINLLLATGARAIVSTIPDMGLSPYALTLEKVNAGTVARLSTLSFEFNARLRTSIDSTRFDGRNFGLVLADDIVQAMVRFPTNYALNNVVDAACARPLPDCTNTAADLVAADASATNRLWADDRHLSPQAHSFIGTQAVSRANNNPL